MLHKINGSSDDVMDHGLLEKFLCTPMRSHCTLIRLQVIGCHEGVCYHDVAALESCRPVLVRARAETGVTYTLVYGPCQTRFGYVSGNRHT